MNMGIQMGIQFSDRVENIVGKEKIARKGLTTHKKEKIFREKEKKSWLPAFCPFSTIFSSISIIK